MKLKHKPDVAVAEIGQLPLAPQKYILSTVEDLSSGGLFQGAEYIEQGGFARARTPHDRDPLPPSDHKTRDL